MRRVSPSVLAREQLQGLLVGGAGRESNIVSALVEMVTRLVVQELLEGEQRDFLGGRGRYDRRGEGQAGSRNGYERGRLRTAEGFIDVAVPQVRDTAEPFRSSLMGFLDGNSEVLESLVNEMYARGLSTRDVEDAFRDATGEMLISKSAVSEITDRLWEDYQTFISRDLSGIEIEYLFVDAVFESLRRHGAKEALLVGWGIAADGGKHLLHLAVGNKESEACWTDFFRSMLSRGLRMPTTITSDGAPGLIKAITVCFPASIRIRCWFHRACINRPSAPGSSGRVGVAPAVYPVEVLIEAGFDALVAGSFIGPAAGLSVGA
jgi:putative transposase